MCGSLFFYTLPDSSVITTVRNRCLNFPLPAKCQPTANQVPADYQPLGVWTRIFFVLFSFSVHSGIFHAKHTLIYVNNKIQFARITCPSCGRYQNNHQGGRVGALFCHGPAKTLPSKWRKIESILITVYKQHFKYLFFIPVSFQDLQRQKWHVVYLCSKWKVTAGLRLTWDRTFIQSPSPPIWLWDVAQIDVKCFMDIWNSPSGVRCLLLGTHYTSLIVFTDCEKSRNSKLTDRFQQNWKTGNQRWGTTVHMIYQTN